MPFPCPSILLFAHPVEQVPISEPTHPVPHLLLVESLQPVLVQFAFSLFLSHPPIPVHAHAALPSLFCVALILP